MSIIEVNNLVRKFGDLIAVDDVSFTVEEGEISGFVGPSDLLLEGRPAL